MRFKLPTLFVLGFVVLAFAIPLTVSARPSVLSQDPTQGAVIKDRLEQLREEFKEKKEEFLQARLRLGPKATEGAKKDAFIKAKEVVLKILDQAIERIQNLVQRVEKSQVLTDERKAKLTADLKSQMSLLSAQRSKVEAAANGEELRAVVKEARTQLVSTREAVKKIVAQILASHIDGILVKLEEIANRLENQIANLKAQGVDVSKFQAQLADGRTKITQARGRNANGDWKLARKRAEEARAVFAKLRGQIKAQQAKLKMATQSATPKATTQGGAK